MTQNIKTNKIGKIIRQHGHKGEFLSSCEKCQNNLFGDSQ